MLRTLDHRSVAVRAGGLSLVVALLLIPLGIWASRQGIGPGVVPIYDAEGRSFWLAGLLLAAAAGFAARRLDTHAARAAQRVAPGNGRYDLGPEFPIGWIYPAVTTFAVVMLLAVYHSNIAIVGCAVLAFLLLLGGVITRHYLFDPDESIRSRAKTGYLLLIHAVAFIALSMVYINKVRSLFSATAVLLIGFLLLLQLSEGEDALFSRRLVYAVVGGLMLGEITWVLNYWNATGWTGGATLLIFFYLAAGLMTTELRRGLENRDLLEYGGVATVAFSIVVFSIFR